MNWDDFFYYEWLNLQWMKSGEAWKKGQRNILTINPLTLTSLVFLVKIS